ncbi:reverse transcriptase [Phytophthora megakarya]|uniref:Reverse transcriptase n=1 Tax=Phytophthora megakarya TaxID=4795 RepID=A0A225W3J2_9STRA|nr:reverse transcriptase [Phytophthora megakarya]
MPKVEYLSHTVSHDGREVNPNDLSALADHGFPDPCDYVIYASVLYERRDIDYAAMEKDMNRSQIQLALASETPDPEVNNLADLNSRWIYAHRSFKVLTEKVATTPILRHFDSDRWLYMSVIGRSPVH